MTRFTLLALCTLFLFTCAHAQQKVRKIRIAQLSEAGVKTYGSAAKDMAGIELKGNRLVASKGYTLWANASLQLAAVPQEVNDPAPLFSTMAERRKYSLPGGGTLIIVCFCVRDEGMLYGDDDCHFEGASPILAECKGSCGCKRANGFEPETPEGAPLITEVQ